TIGLLAEQLKAAGLDGGAAFAELSAQAQFASDTVAGPLFQATAGLGDLLVGMSNSGALTQEMFAGLTQQVSATWKEIEAAGAGGIAPLRVSGQVDGERIAEVAARYSERVLTPYGVGVA